jgi:hypothetical protein
MSRMFHMVTYQFTCLKWKVAVASIRRTTREALTVNLIGHFADCRVVTLLSTIYLLVGDSSALLSAAPKEHKNSYLAVRSLKDVFTY